MLADLDQLRRRAAWRPKRCAVCGSTRRQSRTAAALICAKAACREEYLRLWKADHVMVSRPWMRRIVSFSEPGRGAEMVLECGHRKATDRVRLGQTRVRCMPCRAEVLAKAKRRLGNKKEPRGALRA